MLNSLASQCDVMTSNIYRTSFAYWPLLIDMRKDEALNIVYDIHKVAERIKFSLRWTQNVPLLNRSSRLLFTLSTYLCAFTSTNPEFFAKHHKPMNVWKINDRRNLKNQQVMYGHICFYYNNSKDSSKIMFQSVKNKK